MYGREAENAGGPSKLSSSHPPRPSIYMSQTPPNLSNSQLAPPLTSLLALRETDV